MLIYNAKIVTMRGNDIEHGYIRTDGAKIAEICEMSRLNITPSENDYNAEGMTVYPGFIDAHCHLGAFEDGIGFEGDDGNEETDPITPQLRAIDMINPADYCFTEAARGGVTTVLSGMGSANPIGGTFAALKTYGSKRIDKLIIKAPAAMKFALGENPKTVYNEKNQSPNTRMATAALIREQLYKTKRYIEDKNAYTESIGTDDELAPPDYDIKCEALIPVLEGEIKAHFHCHRADDIFTAMRIAKEFKLDYVLIHATEGGLVADELAEEHSKCVIGPVFSDRCKPELKNQTIENGARLHNAGVEFAICTDHPENPIQYLPIAAGLAIRGGLDERTALEAITSRAAEICGISDRVGTLEVGKDADMVLYKGKFYDVTSVPQLVLVNGEIVK